MATGPHALTPHTPGTAHVDSTSGMLEISHTSSNTGTIDMLNILNFSWCSRLVSVGGFWECIKGLSIIFV